MGSIILGPDREWLYKSCHVVAAMWVEDGVRVGRGWFGPVGAGAGAHGLVPPVQPCGFPHVLVPVVARGLG